MSSQQRVVQTGALPVATTKPLPPGANNIYTAGVITQNQQNAGQNALIGNKQLGGRKRYRGGNPPVVSVVSAPSYAVNKTETNDINAQITGLAVSTQNNAVFDGTVGASSGATAAIAAQQQATYNGTKGGSKSKSRKYLKKGGSWHSAMQWGCLSGGKKSKKSRRTRTKTRTKNTRKYVKRQRR